MNKVGQWLALSFLITCFMLGAGLFALQRWIGTDDFRHRVEVQAGAALGRPVRIADLAVDLFPVPAMALNTVRVGTEPAIQIARLEVRPELAGLLARRFDLGTLLIRNADVAEAAVDDLIRTFPKHDKSRMGGRDGGDGAPRRVVLDALTWRGVGVAATTVSADVQLDPSGLPDTAVLTVLAGRFQGASARLKRADRTWDLELDVAGGTVNGKVEWLQAAEPARLAFKGELETRNVELEILLRKPAAGSMPATDSPMRGKLAATSRFSADARGPGGLLAGLQTHSQFTVRGAVVHGVDLARAVTTVGMNRGGETRLDSLTGQVETRGRAVQLRNLAASSGALSANGNVSIAPNRSLSGRVNVNLGAKVVGNAVGVPLVVGGTLDNPQMTLTRGAMVGAAIGTLVMPGVGTGAGASLGGKLGDKFKGVFGK